MTTLYPQPPPEIVTVTFEKIRYDARAPVRATEGASGWDLTAVEIDDHRKPYVIYTGIKLRIPSGYEGQIRLRSSLAKKGWFIPNAPGTIDSDYRGEIMILLGTNVSQFPNLLGQRVAQLVIAPVPRVQFVEGEIIDDTTRGQGGFGSSGV